ncbi:GNAT family N-acetyltransferase [Streptacidiphilus rugosus]|uniref:GNAT family N-acetyltransferase n=1 Tax=Streptacidiphilus rugosus TaxID=405783 RepID=UPI0009FED461|nr:GNAT family N-acetyltransferase [Streptacidiphilus rugosus]
MDHLTWAVSWENDLPPEGHDALAGLLARAYPRHVELFRDGCTWSGARPELRVVGSAGDRPVAHLGLVRRFLRVQQTGASLLVGDVGLVAVDPDLQGRGVGRALLDHTLRTMTELALPFGFLTCRPEVVPFYRSGGWQRLDGQITRMIDNDHRPEVYDGPAMALPVRAPMTDWPHGLTVDRNGLEV